jgi:hypothetical protein
VELLTRGEEVEEVDERARDRIEAGMVDDPMFVFLRWFIMA